MKRTDVASPLFGLWCAVVCALALAASGFGAAAWASGGDLTPALKDPWPIWRSGAMHPLVELDHLAAFLAVGAWAGAHVRQGWVVLLSFVLMLMVGTWLGFSRAEPLPVELLIAASVVVLGMLLTFRVGAPMVLAAWLAMAVAFVHGTAHGSELRGPAEFWALLGMVCSAALLIGVGLLLGQLLRRSPAWAGRVLGLAVTAIGCFVLLQQLG